MQENWSFPSVKHRDSAIAEVMSMYPDADLTAYGEVGVMLRFVGVLYDMLVSTIFQSLGGEVI